MTPPRQTLYYDGACPLCSKEMSHLRRVMGSNLSLVDVHQLDVDAALPSKADMLLRLHLKSEDNQFLTGLDANVAAWQHTPYGFAFRWLRWPIIRQLADLVYDYWAGARFDKRYGQDRR